MNAGNNGEVYLFIEINRLKRSKRMNTQGPRSTFDRVSKSRNSMTISIFIIQTRTTRAYFFLFYLFFSVSMLNVMSDHLFNATIMSFFSTSKKITILESAMQFI